jgi:squalene-associated FAD-dependent desaturase
MKIPKVAVVGGGLAGMQAAIACADAGLRVSLFETRPRLGGATWSTRKRGLEVDNGQHVFMRCCTTYRAFLARLGVDDQVWIQERLAVPVAAPGGPLGWIRRNRLPAPAHLVPSLLGFPHLPLATRLRAARAASRFASLDPGDLALDGVSVGEWLARQGAGDAACLALFDLLIRPTLNLPAAEASLALAAKVMRTGFLDRADAADIGFARIPFRALHAEPAARVLARSGADVLLRTPVDSIACNGEGVTLRAGGGTLAADAVILATPPEDAARLAPAEAGLDVEALRDLGRSPIVNLHAWFDRRVLPHPFLAGWQTPLQWIFDRTEASGAERGQVLTVSLSAADKWLGHSNAALRAAFEPAFHALLPASRNAEILDFFTISEPAATFRQIPGSRRRRPGNATRHPAVFLAGTFTDTGWPATMESAVRSGRSAADGVARMSPVRAQAA